MNELLETMESYEEEANFATKRIKYLERVIAIHRDSTSDPSEADCLLWSVLTENKC